MPQSTDLCGTCGQRYGMHSVPGAVCPGNNSSGVWLSTVFTPTTTVVNMDELCACGERRGGHATQLNGDVACISNGQKTGTTFSGTGHYATAMDEFCGACGQRRGAHNSTVRVYPGVRCPIPGSSSGWSTTTVFKPTGTYRLATVRPVSLAHHVSLTIQADPPAPPKVQSRWNDSCKRCGGNVYIGFSLVEHEGACR